MNIAISKPKLGKDSKAFLAKKHQMLIDGKWVEARSGKTFAVEDPATEEIIARVPAGEKADIDLAVAAARRAFESGPWSRISPADRSRLVWRWATCWNSTLTSSPNSKRSDNGKPVTNARQGDVRGSIDMFRYMAGWATRLNGETIPVSSPGQLARLHAAGTDRRRRSDHSLEFSADDGGVETRAGTGGRMHHRAQTRGADAALRACASAN